MRIAIYCCGDKITNSKKQIRGQFILASNTRGFESIVVGKLGSRNRKPKDHISITYRKERERKQEVGEEAINLPSLLLSAITPSSRVVPLKGFTACSHPLPVRDQVFKCISHRGHFQFK